MILVTGAAGRVGQRLVQGLTSRGARVRALVHDPAKGARLLGPNVEVVQADYGDAAAMRRMAKDMEKVFITAPTGFDLYRYKKAILEAAEDAGAAHVVNLSMLGASSDTNVALLHENGRADDLLRASAVDVTLLRSHWLLDNLERLAPQIVAEGRILLPLRDAAIAPIASADVAAVATEVLLGPGHLGKSHDLTGPEPLTMHDIAGILSDITEAPISYGAATLEEARQVFIEAGDEDETATAWVDLLDWYAEGSLSETTKTVKRLIGRRPIDARSYLAGLEVFAPEHVTVER